MGTKNLKTLSKTEKSNENDFAMAIHGGGTIAYGYGLNKFVKPVPQLSHKIIIPNYVQLVPICFNLYNHELFGLVLLG